MAYRDGYVIDKDGKILKCPHKKPEGWDICLNCKCRNERKCAMCGQPLGFGSNSRYCSKCRAYNSKRFKRYRKRKRNEIPNVCQKCYNHEAEIGVLCRRCYELTHHGDDELYTILGKRL